MNMQDGDRLPDSLLSRLGDRLVKNLLQNPCVMRRDLFVVSLMNSNLFEPVLLIESLCGIVGYLDVEINPMYLLCRRAFRDRG